MSPSYGHTYLTSYGWTGTGAGLRKGAISKPLAIPPKKNLNGLGKDRDESFPFWDHLFTAASKAITIKVSSEDDDPDATENPSSHTDPASISVPLRRTATGIISNRRPVSGTPASTSGSTTPNSNPNTDTDVLHTNDDANAGTTGRLSLIATAKREAAKRGLYARFFRGPVLGPDDDQRASVNTMLHSAPSSSTSVDFSSVSAPVPDCAGTQDDVNITRETKSKKRKLEDRKETREERRERKRSKKERKATRAAKKAEKAEKLKGKKKRSGDVEQKARKHRDDEVPSEENEACSQSEKARKQARKSIAGSEGEREDTARRSPSNVDATYSLNTVLTIKKKKVKRKDTPH